MDRPPRLVRDPAGHRGRRHLRHLPLRPLSRPRHWRWLTPGAIAATVLWLLASLGFSYYAANFAGYNETYGTLGGVIALLMWLWISAYVVLLGAELNSELELQTAHDTTTGPPLPEGQRGAFAADHNPDDRAAADAARA
jgi:membrane protein